MPKSGSSLLRHYTVEMINHVNPKGQNIVSGMINEGKIKGAGTYVENIDADLIKNLLAISRNEGPVLIKVHLHYTKRLEELLDHKHILMTYNYRDPRSMILSAMDHHKRTKASKNVEFSEYADFNASLNYASYWSQQAIAWKQCPYTYDISYPLFMINKLKVLSEINKRAGFMLSDEILQDIIINEIKSRKYGANQFNKGSLYRYITEMSQAELLLCEEKLGSYIRSLS